MFKASLVLILAFAGSAIAGTPVADGGVYVASQTRYDNGWENQLFIHRVTATGIEKVFATRASGSFGWSDAKTLWTASGNADQVVMQKFVNGVLEKTLTVKGADWKVRPSKVTDLTSNLPFLRITKTGEVWLELCVKYKELDYRNLVCREPVYLRVDGKKFVRSTKSPKVASDRTNVFFLEYPPTSFPKTKAPAGYTVRVKKVTVDGRGTDQKGREVLGAVCTGPDATITWPETSVDLDFIMEPETVTWLRTAPALVEISGPALLSSEPGEHLQTYLLGCKERVDGAEFFGGDLWGVRRDVPADVWRKSDAKAPEVDATWSIYRGDKLVGTVPGSRILMAPH